MDIQATLLDLEEGFWRAAGDRDRYEAHLAGDAVHVIPGWGVVDREPVLFAIGGSPAWERFTIDDPRVVALTEESAALVYSARAERPGQDPYAAAISSVYRHRDDGWELVLHQQTPL